MASYKYVARDSSGARREGFTQAVSTNDVLGWLREKGLTPVSVNEASAGTKQTGRKPRRRRIKSAALGSLCWQLTTMVEGGIPVTSAIETIAEDIENAQLQQVLQQVLEKMKKGEPFSESISQYPKVFNKLACAMVLAGETGGNLPGALRRLAEYFDNRDKLSRKVKGAMAYPIFVSIFIVLIVVFIMTFIVPRFQVIFKQFGGDLPAFTKGFMGFYEMLRNNVVFIIGSLFLIIVLAVAAFKTRKGHYLFSRIVLRLPLFGKVLSQTFLTVFCRTMASLLGAGVSVLEVFDILAAMTTNDVIKDAVIRARERIVAGSNIYLGMAESGFFPNVVIKMVQVGEESGSLSNVLERTASYYERKVDSTITTLMALLEPIMIVITGAIVMVVVLALYLPIFSMSAH
ncbi:MAG TPA: type II secretion system F family protein [Sedimentisphaerales bacterium]|nr:type II secretion system F family protein [Sedimentisphaerales bacterium]